MDQQTQIVTDIVDVLKSSIENTAKGDRALFDLCAAITARVVMQEEELRIHHNKILQLQQRIDIMLEMMMTSKNEVN